MLKEMFNKTEMRKCEKCMYYSEKHYRICGIEYYEKICLLGKLRLKGKCPKEEV